MTYDLQLRQRQDNLPEALDPYAPHGGDGQGEPESLFIRLHRLLRGRYLWALLLGLVLGGAGGYCGYAFRRPIWSSTGLIQVKANISPVMHLLPEHQTTIGYEQFRQSQVSLLKQQRVVDIAMQSPEWRALKRPGTTDEVWQDFIDTLKVEAPPGNEMVLVNFSDPDKDACTAAVKGVVRAYSQIYLENEDRQQEEKIRTLDAMRVALTSERDAKRDAIRSIGREFGTDDLRPNHKARQDTLNQVESELRQIEAKLAGLIAIEQPTTQPTTQPVVEIPKVPVKLRREMDLGEIVFYDLEMRRTYNEYQETEARMSSVLQKLGPNHPSVKEVRAMQDVRRQALERFAKHWREDGVEAPLTPSGYPGGNGSTPTNLDVANTLRRQQEQEISKKQLEAAKQKLSVLIQPLQKEARDIGQKMLEIERLREEEKEREKSLAEVVSRIDTLRTEAKTAGRVNIISEGDRPVKLKDPRIPTAALLGLVGFSLGVGFFALLGWRDHRMHTLDDARIASKLPLLGILPELPQDLADPEQASMAAHCVHQIRTLLQVGHRGEERRTFAITSPAAGTGKTSLTLSLGVSFAAASSKTLIIDCDVIGGGLTARIETIIRRKIGQILKREGTITEQQLDTALRLAHNSQRKLGEIMVELGYLVPEDIDRALAAQQDEPPVGMLDALSGESIEDCVAETGIQGLCILPIGGASPSDVSKLSPKSLRDLLARARERFDIVLIDTGPVPGSIEASAAATAADGVILVVARGDDRPMVERSLEHLQNLGACLAGMVFNRAGERDVDAATTTTRLTSSDRTGRGPVPGPREQVDSRFGPIAGAVATTSPTGKPDTRSQQS